MATKKPTRSSTPSNNLIKKSLKVHSAKHIPPISLSLAVTALIKRSTRSSETKQKEKHMQEIQTTTTNISSSALTMELNEFNILAYVLSFQRTLREHEEKFKMIDLIIAERNRLRKELEEVKAKLEASDLRYQQLLNSKPSSVMEASPIRTMDHSTDRSNQFPPLLPAQLISGTFDSINGSPKTYASLAAVFVPQKPVHSNKLGIPRRRQAISRYFQPPPRTKGSPTYTCLVVLETVIMKLVRHYQNLAYRLLAF
ncbi:hypothetical protein BDB01DRAFT_884913 [Pilobolus umbonatus]|nr:hypothetical protein BDB01DRAFT_884913 [Pilobolus umbonatus]